MSKIKDLIKELCPNGVSFYRLSEIGDHYTGLSGKSKKDFENGNCKYITYSNIFNNPSTNLDIEDLVNIKENEKQNTIKYKDILVAGSSETLEDSGMISVVTKEPKEKIYLNSFCFGFRLRDIFYRKFNASFLKYLFRDNNFRNEIITCSFGVTRYNLSKEKFLKIKIPCPPLEVQEEIAKILDKFSELEAEVEGELEVRKSQYKFYLNYFFDKPFEKKINLGEFVNFLNGKAFKQEELLYSGKYKVIRVGNFASNEMYYYSDLELNEDKYINKGDLIYLWSASFGPKIWNDSKAIYHYHIWKLKFDEQKIMKKYLYYFLDYDKNKLKSLTTNSTMPHISMTNMVKRSIPCIFLDEQEKIVKILDKVTDLIENLEKELELRRKQFEYYRNKLLSFEEMIVND